MAKVRTVVGKRGKTYRVQFMRNGEKIDRSFSRLKDAELFLARITASDDLADALTSVALNTITLSEVVRQYLDQYRGRDSSGITRTQWWAERLGDKPMGKIQRQHVKAALDALDKAGMADSTINRYKAALSSVFEWFNDEHDTKHNPAREVRQRTEDSGRTRALSDDELTRLLAAAKVSKWDRLHLLISMAVFTGARRSELLGLRWTDVDLKARTAHLSRTKNGTQRVLTLPPALVLELMKFRQVGDAYIFPHTSQLHGPFQYFDHHWKACLIESEVADFRFHDLRHSCASMLAKSGASLLEIAQVLGHKSITMTARYSHLCNGHKQQLTDSVFGGIAL